MLAYILALAVGLGSLAIYLTAFFLPEIHRKSDFIWSGVGLFYALVLWVCAGRITGGVLLGQVASVALLGWLGWQTLALRRELIPAGQQTELPSPDEIKEKLTTLLPAGLLTTLQERVGGLLGSLSRKKSTAETAKTQLQDKVATTPEVSGPDTEADAIAQSTPPTPEALDPETETEAIAQSIPTAEGVELGSAPETKPEPIRPHPPSPELVEKAQESASDSEARTVEEIPPEAELAPPAEPPDAKRPEEGQA